MKYLASGGEGCTIDKNYLSRGKNYLSRDKNYLSRDKNYLSAGLGLRWRGVHHRQELFVKWQEMLGLKW